MRSSIGLLLLLSASPAAAQAPPAQLLVESAGRDQVVQLAPEDGDGERSSPCPTPCRILVEPGRYRLLARGRGVLASNQIVDVPPTGLQLRLRAPSKGRHVAGAILTAFGAATLPIAILYTAVGVSEARRGDSDFPVLLPGLVATLLAIATLAPGIALLATTRRGIDDSDPPRFTLGAAPTSNGFALVGSGRF